MNYIYANSELIIMSTSNSATKTLIEAEKNLPPIQITFFGSSASGKSALLKRITKPNEQLNQEYSPTNAISVSKKFSTLGLTHQFREFPGGNRFVITRLSTIQQSDIIVICIDQTNKESFEEAKLYAEEIGQTNPQAKIIIALTQQDKKSKLAVSDEEIQTAFGIEVELIKTSAVSGDGIKELYSSLIFAGKELNHTKAGLVTDGVFLKAFRANFITSLMKAKNMRLTQGALSRILDSLVLPIVDKETFKANLEKVGSIMAYMRPILNSAADLLLNESKSRLHDNVINAIGPANYALLVSGKINEDGTITANPGKELVFAKEEAEVARKVMAAVLLNYSQSLNKYTLSPEEKVFQEHRDELFNLIQALEKQITAFDGNKTPEKKNIVITSSEELTIKLKAIIESSKKALEDEDSDLLAVLGDAKALLEATNEFLGNQIDKFSNNVILPLSTMTKNFSMEMLDEPKGGQLTLIDLEQKINIFYQMAKKAEAKLKSSVPSDTTAATIKAVNALVGHLGTALGISEAFPGASDDTKRDFMLNAYNAAVSTFVRDIHDDILTVEPSKLQSEGILDFLYRLVRALVTFSFTLYTEEELLDEERFSQESNLKAELLAMKPELEVTTTKPDEIDIEKEALIHNSR